MLDTNNIIIGVIFVYLILSEISARMLEVYENFSFLRAQTYEEKNRGGFLVVGFTSFSSS